MQLRLHPLALGVWTGDPQLMVVFENLELAQFVDYEVQELLVTM